MIMYNFLKDGFAILFFVGFAAGFMLSSKIKKMLKEFNPQIWLAIGSPDGLFEGSAAFRKIIQNPPTEITHKPLLRLFVLMKTLEAVMLFLLIGIVLLNIALSH
jgi:hypothetical protein